MTSGDQVAISVTLVFIGPPGDGCLRHPVQDAEWSRDSEGMILSNGGRGEGKNLLEGYVGYSRSEVVKGECKSTLCGERPTA